MAQNTPKSSEALYGRRTRPGEEPLLRKTVARAEKAIATHVRKTIPGATVFSLGAIDLFPGTLAFWVRTPTDAQRDSLLANRPSFDHALRKIVATTDYPKECLPFLTFTAQSDETVDREYGGNWYYAVK